MQYLSTRGKSPKISFEEAIIKGIADDGGLYVPERVPKIDLQYIQNLAGMAYTDVSSEITKLFSGGLSEREIRECAGLAYNERSFSSPDVTPLCKLDDRLSVLELFHGPTSAFKDVALQLLPPLLSLSLRKTGVKESIAILVATSGDTGKAALEGFRDVPGISILVFYPKDGVSEAQKLQMITQEGKNVSVASVDGNFDDAQTGVKAIFADEGANNLLRGHNILLSSANSINWGRLMPQITYYFRAYASLIKNGEIANGEPISFIVPTGNFGNILAGWYAREMGLPVSRFICASNSNKVLADFIKTGIYDRNRDFVVTMSPAMDILISSNLERLLFELSGRDAACVNGWMAGLSANGWYDVGEDVHKKIKGLFFGGFASESQTAAAIKAVYDKYNYLMDTHTAVGMHVLSDYDEAAAKGVVSDNAGGGRAEKMVIVATASPYKFAKDVYLAVCGQDADAVGGTPDDIECIELLSMVKGAPPVPAPLRNLREKPVLHHTGVEKSQIKATALKMLIELVK